MRFACFSYVRLSQTLQVLERSPRHGRIREDRVRPGSVPSLLYGSSGDSTADGTRWLLVLGLSHGRAWKPLVPCRHEVMEKSWIRSACRHTVFSKAAAAFFRCSTTCIFPWNPLGGRGPFGRPLWADKAARPRERPSENPRTSTRARALFFNTFNDNYIIILIILVYDYIII